MSYNNLWKTTGADSGCFVFLLWVETRELGENLPVIPVNPQLFHMPTLGIEHGPDW